MHSQKNCILDSSGNNSGQIYNKITHPGLIFPEVKIWPVTRGKHGQVPDLLWKAMMLERTGDLKDAVKCWGKADRGTLQELHSPVPHPHTPLPHATNALKISP